MHADKRMIHQNFYKFIRELKYILFPIVHQLLSSSIKDSNDTIKKGTESETESDEHQTSTKGRCAESAADDISQDTCENDNTCSICLGDLDEEGEKCYVRNCSHSFHRSCIKNWIARSLSCPVCRKQMIENSKLIEYMSTQRQLFYGGTEVNSSTATSVRSPATRRLHDFEMSSRSIERQKPVSFKKGGPYMQSQF